MEDSRDLRGRTFRFSVRIIALCAKLDEQPGVSRTLARQLLRSGTSIGANVEEATAGQSRADFVAKLFISLKEARETAYWLRLLTASKIGQRNEIDALATEADELRRILAATVNNTRKKGL